MFIHCVIKADFIGGTNLFFTQGNQLIKVVPFYVIFLLCICVAFFSLVLYFQKIEVLLSPLPLLLLTDVLFVDCIT